MGKMRTEFETSQSLELPVESRAAIDVFIDLLFTYNQKFNLISRQITRASLLQLVGESLILERYINRARVIDAGSGNGILGIPVALLDKERPVILVETKGKKVLFLEEARKNLKLDNVRVFRSTIEDYMREENGTDISLVSRGFPHPQIFFNFLRKGIIRELLLITSGNKLEKINLDMVKMEQKTYNLPLRNNLKIIKMENVSRETYKQKM